jgi:hypothetical protein
MTNDMRWYGHDVRLRPVYLIGSSLGGIASSNDERHADATARVQRLTGALTPLVRDGAGVT